jgi:hypothetical protein
MTFFDPKFSKESITSSSSTISFEQDEETGDIVVLNAYQTAIGYIYANGRGGFSFETSKRHPGPLSSTALLEIAEKIEELEAQDKREPFDPEELADARRFFESLDEISEKPVTSAKQGRIVMAIGDVLFEINRMCDKLRSLSLDYDPSKALAPTLSLAGIDEFESVPNWYFASVNVLAPSPLTQEALKSELEIRLSKHLYAMDFDGKVIVGFAQQ